MYTIELPRKTINEFLTTEDLRTYRLPSVQRDFVWEEDEVIELIDSLIRGYPTGVVTVLETNISFPSVPLIDVDNTGSHSDGQVIRYVLDGQQRLTSLLLIRNGWKIKRDGKEISITPIMLNPDDNQLRIKGKREWGKDFSQLVRWTLHKETPNQTIPRLQKTMEDINREFLVRPLGFYTVKVNQDAQNRDQILKDMAEIFTRINRAGIKLGNLEMFLSFFAGEAIGKGEIIKIYDQMNSKYNLDLEPIIRLVFSNFNRTQSQISKVDSFKGSARYVRDNYSENQILDEIHKSSRAIDIVMNLLENEFGITNVDIMPSQTSLVILFKYVLNGYGSIDKIPEKEKHKMLKWFIISSFHGLYSSQTDKRLEDDLKIISKSSTFPLNDLMDSMKGKNFRTEIFEQDFKNIDFNILRGNAGKKFLFLLYILLHKNGATDWASNLLSKNFKNLARHHILPKENEKVKQELDDDVLRNHLGNITFIDSGKNKDIEASDPDEYLSQMAQGALEEHFIPLDKKLWLPGKYEEFINTRTDMLWKAFQKLMTDLSQ